MIESYLLTESLSNFIDAHIRPLVVQLPSYLRDMGNFLEHLSNIQELNDIYLATLDITSLYTNIPHSMGLHALKNVL